MKARIILGLLVFCAPMFSADEKQRDPSQAQAGTPRVIVSLNDTSCVVGVPRIETVPLKTSFADMSVSLSKLSSVTFDNAHEIATFRLRNGDRLQGTSVLSELRLKTVFGEVAIAIEHVKSFRMDDGKSGVLSAELQKGLVLYFSFDRDEGGTITDLSGHGNHGAIHGVTFDPNGRIGGAFRFDGNDHFVSVPNSEDLTLADDADKTFSFWWKTMAFPTSWSGFLTKRRVMNQHRGLVFALHSQHEYYLVNKIDHWAAFSIPTKGSDWEHVVLTKTRLTWKIFHNGRKLLVSRNTGWPFADTMETDVPLLIGSDAVTHAGFDGWIDELRIYDRCLSEIEILELYEAEKTAGETDASSPQ